MKIPDAATAQRYRASVAKMTEFAGRLYRAGSFAVRRARRDTSRPALTPGQRSIRQLTCAEAELGHDAVDRGLCWRYRCMGMNPPVMAALNGDCDTPAVQGR